jgi:hypothetical protein
MKNKTLAVWLTFFLGPTGLHRVYLLGKYDLISVALLVPSALGFYGVRRLQELGVDDQLSWLLTPMLGMAIAACGLTAIVYGLMDAERWNRRFNASAPADAKAGQSSWLTIFGVALSLLLGATALIATIAFSFQRYFEYQYGDGLGASASVWVQTYAAFDPVTAAQRLPS